MLLQRFLKLNLPIIICTMTKLKKKQKTDYLKLGRKLLLQLKSKSLLWLSIFLNIPNFIGSILIHPFIIGKAANCSVHANNEQFINYKLYELAKAMLGLNCWWDQHFYFYCKMLESHLKALYDNTFDVI